MLDFNEELAKFQPCADLEEAEENIYGKELEEIKKNKTELYKANQMIKKYNQALNYAKQGNDDLAMLQLKNVEIKIDCEHNLVCYIMLWQLFLIL